MLALLSLAWMQLAMAGHQFEHDVSGSLETCEICIQFDRADDALVPQLSNCDFHGLALPLAHAAQTCVIAAEVFSGFRSRAPPKL